MRVFRRAVGVAWLAALGGCGAAAEPVAPIALHLEGAAQSILERLDTFELRVYDGAASCDEASGVISGGMELGSPLGLHVGTNAAIDVSAGERVMGVTGREGDTDVVRGCTRVTLVAGMQATVPIDLLELVPGDTCANPTQLIAATNPVARTFSGEEAEDYMFADCQPGDDDSVGDQVYELSVPVGGQSVLLGRLPTFGSTSTGTIALSKGDDGCAVDLLACPVAFDRPQFINCSNLAEGTYDVIVDAAASVTGYDLMYRTRAPLATDTTWVLDSEPGSDATRTFGPVTYVSLDQAASTTLLTGGADRDEGLFQLDLSGFSISLYGSVINKVFVSVNGAVLFTGGAPPGGVPIDCVDQMVPPMAAVFLDDLIVPAGGDIRYEVSGVAPRKRLSIEWFHVDSKSCTGGACGGLTSFRVDIDQNGDILYNYAGEVQPPTGVGAGACTDPLLGCAASVGLRVLPPMGTMGPPLAEENIQCADPTAPDLGANRAIEFLHPDACEVL